MDNKIRDEAAEWVLLLSESSNTDFPTVEWREWMSRSPEHQEIFKSMLNIWGLADSIEFLPEFAPEVAINHPREASNRQYGSQLAAAMFFGVCIILMWIANSGSSHQSEFIESEFQGRYSTAKSEHRSLRLPDGTQIDMGAESTLDIDFNQHRRDIILHNGEGFFQVANDSQRPLTVYANKSATRVVGTAFNVKNWLDRTTVSVSEGVVEVTAMDEPAVSLSRQRIEFTRDGSTPSLTPGQAVSVTNSGQLSAIEHINPSHQIAWKMGRIVFLNKQLDVVVADLNRYSHADIIIRGDSVSMLKFSGTVQEEDIVEWLYSLPRVFDVDVFSENGQLVITSAIH